MGFLIVGLLLLALYLGGIDPVAKWHWGWLVLPFGLAAAWWAFVDATGMTQRRAERKMEERKVARRQRDMAALGLGARGDGGAKPDKKAPRDPQS